jgi:AraC-like DNA-binding protein
MKRQKDTKPLARFPVSATNRVEEAEGIISQSIAGAQISRVDDRSNFRLELNAVKLGCCSLIYNYFGTQTILDTVLDIDHAIFVLGLSIPISLNIDSEQFIVTPNKAVIIERPKHVRIERPSNSEILYLRVSLQDLWNHFEKLTHRHHRGTLIFDKQVSVVNGAGALLKGVMGYLVELFSKNESVNQMPAIRRSIDNLLMTTLLSLPHNKMDRLHENNSNAVAPAVVYRAEEYMLANLTKPINTTDLVRVSECSRSALFSAFRSTRGYSPMEFITEQRLQKARKHLLSTNHKASVASIASNCGFNNASWFSQIYKKRFGERPSDTLRNME